MLDLNALQVFERVAALRSFSAAARALELPKSTVSRMVSQLEAELGTRLLQRTTREVALTESGEALRERCSEIVSRVGDTVDYIGNLSGKPRGLLKINSGIGFGINVLTQLLPEFLAQYPEVDVSLDLNSKALDLVANHIDVAIRIGPQPDSQLVGSRLGTMRRFVCASPAYLEQKGWPVSPAELPSHQTIEMPGPKGRMRNWDFTGPDKSLERVSISPRISVNDALTIYRLLLNDGGIGCVSEYLCAPDIAAGRLVRLLPDWTLPSADVTVLFPSNRELAPSVRAFLDFMKRAAVVRRLWEPLG